MSWEHLAQFYAITKSSGWQQLLEILYAPEEARLAWQIPFTLGGFVASEHVGSRFLRAALARAQDLTGA